MLISRKPLGTSKLKAMTVLAIGAIALSACTNASQNATPGSTSTDSDSAKASFDPSTITKDDSLAAMVPAAIKSKGTLTIGSDTSYAPAEFLLSLIHI